MELITIRTPSGGIRLTQEEIDAVKAYEPPKESLHLAVVHGDWYLSPKMDYLVLQGRMLETAKNSILFNNANKENN